MGEVFQAFPRQFIATGRGDGRAVGGPFRADLDPFITREDDLVNLALMLVSHNLREIILMGLLSAMYKMLT